MKVRDSSVADAHAREDHRGHDSPKDSGGRSLAGGVLPSHDKASMVRRMAPLASPSAARGNSTACLRPALNNALILVATSSAVPLALSVKTISSLTARIAPVSSFCFQASVSAAASREILPVQRGCGNA